jgi:hypothetical protein
MPSTSPARAEKSFCRLRTSGTVGELTGTPAGEASAGGALVGKAGKPAAAGLALAIAALAYEALTRHVAKNKPTTAATKA